MNKQVQEIISLWASGSSYCREQQKGSVISYLAELIKDLYKDVQELKTEIEIIKSHSSETSDDGTDETTIADSVPSSVIKMEEIKC